MKRNVPAFGLVIGLLMPLLGLFIMYLIWFHGQHVSYVIQQLVDNHDLASKVLSLSLLAELIPFVYYTNKRLDLTARGILVATVLYFVFIILVKYVW